MLNSIVNHQSDANEIGVGQLNQTNMDLSKVTRFEVINHTQEGMGRELVKYDVKVDASLQDDGRTLKIFLKDRCIQCELDNS